MMRYLTKQEQRTMEQALRHNPVAKDLRTPKYKMRVVHPKNKAPKRLNKKEIMREYDYE